MEFKIGNKKVGDNHPALVVAELSGNHMQRFDLAVKTIKAMKKAGADAVKLQTYTPESLTLDYKNSKYEYFRKAKKGLWKGSTPFQIFKLASTSWSWQPKLKKLAESLGLICFSAAYDYEAVEFLNKMNIAAYKIASPEITDIRLIERAAATGKPIIISTGIATLQEIKEATQACYRMGNKQIALLKCVSAYPTPLNEVNLRTIPTLKKKFKTIIGLSDHTLSLSVGMAAVTLGAKIIEKHFILSRKLASQDRAFSLEPQEFENMITSIREVEKVLGDSTYRLTPAIKAMRHVRRSLFVVKNINKGESITEDNIKSIRPGYGLKPKYLINVLGKKVKRDIKRGTPLRLSMIAKNIND